MKKIIWISSILIWFIALFVPKASLSFSLFVLAYLMVAGPVFAKTLKSILKGNIFTVNFLMVIATIGAFIVNEPAEASIAMILYLLGEEIEDYAIYRSQKSISALLALKPQSATLWQESGNLVVSPETVAIGDILLATTGDKIALDGTIIEGEAYIDNSIITGESVPVHGKLGDSVLSGGLIKEGSLKISVTKPYQDSTISKMLAMIEHASESKSTSEKMMSRFATYYTPIVVGLAFLLTFIPVVFWSADAKTWLTRSFVFLAASCPCSLIISIPLTYFAGLHKASQNGILIKGANYLEAFSKIDTLVLDKTGTLTKGSFDLVAIESDSHSEEDVLTLAAMIEQYSKHPIAVSIRQAYTENMSRKTATANALPNISPTQFQEISGKGIVLHYQGNEYLCGNQSLLRDYGVSYPTGTSPYSVVYLAKDKEYIGSITIADQLKPDSVEAISQFRKLGLDNLQLFTGDRTEIANHIAREVGIDIVKADMLPSDKFNGVQALLNQKAANSKIAFVGDGINDASVLKLADIGIAMGGLGADIAVESADIILTNDRLSSLVLAFGISQKTARILKQNLILSLGFKGMILLLGSMGLVGMWAAVFADVGIMLLASLNSLRAGK